MKNLFEVYAWNEKQIQQYLLLRKQQVIFNHIWNSRLWIPLLTVRLFSRNRKSTMETIFQSYISPKRSILRLLFLVSVWFLLLVVVLYFLICVININTTLCICILYSCFVFIYWYFKFRNNCLVLCYLINICITNLLFLANVNIFVLTTMEDRASVNWRNTF